MWQMNSVYPAWAARRGKAKYVVSPRGALSQWASMDHSVELRTPLVDAHLLASWQTVLPSFSRHPGKRLLAGAPGNPLPRAIIARRKTGFGIPIGRWLTAGSQANRKTLDSRAWAIRVVEAYDREWV
jgi:asparagine synthase (glutamine-hydrolysing)